MLYTIIMKIIKSYSRRKKILILLALALAITVGGVAIVYANKQSQEKESSSTSEPNTSSMNTPDEDNPNIDPRAEQTGAGGITTSDESGSAHAFPTTKPNLSVQIKSVEQEGETLSVNATILPGANGTCTAELSRSGNETISKSSNFNGDSCGVSSIPIDTATPGAWDLTIKVIVDSNVATTTRSVTLR